MARSVGRAASAGPLRLLARPRGKSSEDLERRLSRIERGLYQLYEDLGYFLRSSPEDRQRLRRRLSWPDVGHITSLARALAEEDRFNEWVRFNRVVRRAA